MKTKQEKNQEKYLLSAEDYGPLYQYVTCNSVTDINWNGYQLWIDDLAKGRYCTEEQLDEAFTARYASLLANVSSSQYNRMNPVLEIETNELRISIVHHSVARTGTTISIRKIPAIRRLSKTSMVTQGYCSEKINSFLRNCIKAKCSIAVCGMPGVGKTELLKYLTKYIPAHERVITIEDTLEMHYRKINPEKDCVELKVDEKFTYTDAIKACLRQLPRWLVLSEVRSIEVRYLLEALSAGCCGLTTLHTDDVRNIPDRIKNMAEGSADASRIINDTYALINIGVLIRSHITDEGIRRRIEQICIFDRSGEKGDFYDNSITMIAENGKLLPEAEIKLPLNFQRKMLQVEVDNPFIRRQN